MEIVDAQIHVWGQGLPSNDAHWQVTSFTVAQAMSMMDEAGVDAAVIHPPSWDPDSDVMALDAATQYPDRFAVMGSVPLERGQSEKDVASWRDHPGRLGIRYTFLREPQRSLLESGQLEWLWQAASRAQVPVAMLATDSLDTIGGIASRHPGLRITIDHLGGRGGNTTLKDDAAMVHFPSLLALARFPNVAVKVTGAPGYSSEPYPFRPMHDYLQQIFDHFGPDRMFWGTDISKMPCSWRECIDLFTRELPWLGGADLEKVMGKSIRQWWGWPRGT